MYVLSSQTSLITVLSSAGARAIAADDFRFLAECFGLASLLPPWSALLLFSSSNCNEAHAFNQSGPVHGLLFLAGFPSSCNLYIRRISSFVIEGLHQTRPLRPSTEIDTEHHLQRLFFFSAIEQINQTESKPKRTGVKPVARETWDKT